jgi:hypothetical protein
MLPGVSPREVHHLTACTACTALTDTGREDRGCRGDGVGDARGERLSAIIHLGARILLSQRVNQKKKLDSWNISTIWFNMGYIWFININKPLTK